MEWFLRWQPVRPSGRCTCLKTSKALQWLPNRPTEELILRIDWLNPCIAHMFMALGHSQFSEGVTSWYETGQCCRWRFIPIFPFWELWCVLVSVCFHSLLTYAGSFCIGMPDAHIIVNHRIKITCKHSQQTNKHADAMNVQKESQCAVLSFTNFNPLGHLRLSLSLALTS
jgi:hypothetical protein